jgi:hypothetical protein
LSLAQFIRGESLSIDFFGEAKNMDLDDLDCLILALEVIISVALTGTFTVPAQANVLTGTNYGNASEFSGSATAAPATCSGNGEQGCVTDASFQAAAPQGSWTLTATFPGPGYYTGVTGAPTASLRSSATIAGTPGAITDCGADGSNCFLPSYVISTQPKKAINYDTIEIAKMLTTQTVSVAARSDTADAVLPLRYS